MEYIKPLNKHTQHACGVLAESRRYQHAILRGAAMLFPATPLPANATTPKAALCYPCPNEPTTLKSQCQGAEQNARLYKQWHEREALRLPAIST